MHLNIAKNWLSRIGNLFETGKSRAGEKIRCGMVRLMTLFAGETVSGVHCNMSQVTEIRTEIE